MRVSILLLIALNITLLIASALLYPAVLYNGGTTGIVAATVMLLIYGYLALAGPFALGKAKHVVWKTGALLGLISGLLLSADLLSGYVFPNPAISANTSLISYGLMFLIIFIAGFTGTKRSGKLTEGIATALWTIITALLLWFFVSFAFYLIYSRTPSGAAFLRDEMQSDFIRSGAADYQSFVLSDLYGAGFFHLLSGLIVSVILGTTGGLVSKIGKHHE